jgi:hypothetical protein
VREADSARQAWGRSGGLLPSVCSPVPLPAPRGVHRQAMQHVPLPVRAMERCVSLVVVGISVHEGAGRRLPSCHETDAATGRRYPPFEPGLTCKKRLDMVLTFLDSLELQRPYIVQSTEDTREWPAMPTVSASGARRS